MVGRYPAENPPQRESAVQSGVFGSGTEQAVQIGCFRYLDGHLGKREFMVLPTVVRKKESFFLDFALFCKDANIAIECDGDVYHTAREQVSYDKEYGVKIQNIRFQALRTNRF